ncbi:MAG: FG-GAP repeat protein, partial [Xanthomonadales bacterium]|nr:FG-GAP repeat protein [Xanthomonadales bacterium]
SYVVFGKADNAPVDLANLGSDGFRIDGIDAGDRSGNSVSGAGDVNGDGLADLLIGATNAGDNAGETYVVFGKSDSATVDLATLGSGGFRIDGVGGDRSGSAVSGAGDVNGDGLADLLIGAFLASSGNNVEAGQSLVVFGKADSVAVDLANLGTGGFTITGIDGGDRSGGSVSGAGDVNGDGLADVIIGAYGGDPRDRGNAGESYVVFGKADSAPVALATLGQGGFLIEGGRGGDFSGRFVAGAGDVNGDGLADLLVGATLADPGGRNQAGESYVVFGKSDGASVDLGNLGARGFRLNGIDAGDQTGRTGASAGDVNGDGLADVIIGAHLSDPGGNESAGESYVVFSTAAPPQTATVRARSANGNPPQTAFGVSGSGSNHSTPDGRAFVNFANGADPGSSASSETMTLFRSPCLNVEATAGCRGVFVPAVAAFWRLQTTRENWSNAELRLRYLDSELLIDNENRLQIVFSVDNAEPFIPLPSIVNPNDNSITALISEPGFYYIGEGELPDGIFANDFE